MRVSEIFYSIQGEGRSAGCPSVFLRLAGCNLLCQGSWVCDTIQVWRKGTEMSDSELLQAIDKLIPDNVVPHLVVTGGEPLLWADKLARFFAGVPTLYAFFSRIELETNGTKAIPTALSPFVSQVNCSPKLSNSGMKKGVRIVPEVLKQFAQDDRVDFKFVIGSSEDATEVVGLMDRFLIAPERTYLMPATPAEGAGLRWEENKKMVVELCKGLGVNYSPRLHVDIWNKMTGV